MKKIKPLLDLGVQPLVNNLCKSASEALHARKFLLSASIHHNLLIHLDEIVPPELLFTTYVYRSGTSMPFVKHCEEMWELFTSCRRGTVIDIGGNDGTLLKAFMRVGGVKNVINVDASESMREENEAAGIRYVRDFWSEKLDLPQADIIVSTNVFQHNSEVHKFLSGIKKHLHPDGLWLLEFPYTLNTLQTLQFDQFYHEHYFYWLLTPLVDLLAQYGMNIVYTEEKDMHGGTMRLLIAKNKTPWTNCNVQHYLDEEKKFEYAGWQEKVFKKIKDDMERIKNLEGTVAFFGAAAKGCVYLNALDIKASDKFLYVVDDTPTKQGMFVPGTGLPIFSRSALQADPPDNLIILAHNFKDYIRNSLSHQYFGNVLSMY